jgi:hypothetical protein
MLLQDRAGGWRRRNRFFFDRGGFRLTEDANLPPASRIALRAAYAQQEFTKPLEQQDRPDNALIT